MEFFSLSDSLLLGPPVLEPDLDLSVCQLELPGEVRPLGDGEVTLGFVFVLQLLELITGEGSPGLPVSSVLPQDGPGWNDWRGWVALEVPQHDQLGGIEREHGGQGGGGRHAVGPQAVWGTGGGSREFRLCL